jgi:hypothetical protein
MCSHNFLFVVVFKKKKRALNGKSTHTRTHTGGSDGTNYLNDLYVLDLDTMAWE